jgi:hypothetical protein
MNYVAVFIYNLIEDEEEAFYYLYGLLTNTDYSMIFLNDLSKLKQYFHVFDRLISIYMPELNTYLKNNGINVSFFCSPWFITLFSNSIYYTTDIKNPLILIRIWDGFLIVKLFYLSI